jgi:outer membrane protein TolC
MNGPQIKFFVWLLIPVFAAGCHPSQPFYFHEDGDLSHYIDRATEIAYPDVEQARLAEVTNAAPPLSVTDPDFNNFWDITLEESVSLALQNSTVIRNAGLISGNGVPGNRGFADALLTRTLNQATVYDSAISESSTLGGARTVDRSSGSVFLQEVAGRTTQQGVEDALSEFDAQFFSSVSLNTQDRPRNVLTGNIFNPQQFKGRSSSFLATLSKKTATGAVFSFRNRTAYSENNIPIGQGRALPTDWTTEMEIEAQYPLLRGRGTQINRIPVTLARINTDISIADFEDAIRALLLDVESVYWDLHCAYHALETARVARDSALVTWQNVSAKAARGVEGAQREAQVLEQYHFFSAQLETAQSALFDVENRLRWLIGLTPTDRRVLRPINDPTKAEVTFDWETVKQDALVRSPELRQQKWRIKQNELELIAARNQMLPHLNAFSTYRWVGVGDDLVNADRNGINFPTAGSTAFDELFEGNYQELVVGLEFQPHRFGARRPRAGLRNAQLRLVRAKKQLEEMELQQIHLISSTWRDVKSQYSQTIWQFNRWMDSHKEVQAAQALYSGGQLPLDQVLDAHRRRADSQNAFYLALCNYNKAIAQLHFFRGTLLEFNNINLAEGPWPNKAYDDALGKARERDASYYLDYGSTRPNVVSRGPVDGGVPGLNGQIVDGQIVDGGIIGNDIVRDNIVRDNIVQDNIVQDPNEAVGSGVMPEYLKELPTGQGQPLVPAEISPKTPELERTPIGRRPATNPDLQAPIRAETPKVSRRQIVRSVSDSRPVANSPTTASDNPLRNASYSEPALR